MFIRLQQNFFLKTFCVTALTFNKNQTKMNIVPDRELKPIHRLPTQNTKTKKEKKNLL